MNETRGRNTRAGMSATDEQLAREQATWDDAAMQGLCEAGREEVVRGNRATRDSVSDTTVNAAAEPYESLSPDSSLELSPLKRNHNSK